MQYCGAAYFPEAWPKERWDRDIELMQQANFNVVRMGEFAWSRFETRDGVFDLDWWKDIVSRLGRAGISVLACTPSAAPPAWLTRNDESVLCVDEEGRRASHGSRRHYCPTSPRYREYATRAVAAIGEAVADEKAVIAWQIDNEIAPDSNLGCCCEACTAGFREWLRKRYGTLETLNDAWGTVFWSGDFSAWEEIAPPYPVHARKSWRLDYVRYQCEVLADFGAVQAETLRGINPKWRITSNAWAGLSAGFDVRPLFDCLDFASNDGYLDYYAGRDHYTAVWDFYRTVKGPPQPFWIAETGAWNPCNIYPDMHRSLRPWAWLAAAKGAEGLIYFRWRQSVMGEEDHPAILDWSGEPGRGFEMVAKTLGEIASLRTELQASPLPTAEAALLFDWDSGYYAMMTDRPHMQHLAEMHASLSRLGIQADFLSNRPDLDLSAYRLLVLPQVEFVDAGLAEKLHAFVETGGTLLGTPRLGTLDPNGKYLTTPMPGGLTDLFGITVRERCDLNEGRYDTSAFQPERSAEAPTVAVRLSLPGDGEMDARGAGHMEMLTCLPETRVLGQYTGGAFAETPIISAHSHGKGQALYLACGLDEAGLRAVMLHAAQSARLDAWPEKPERVDVLGRGSLRFYLNHSREAACVPRRGPGTVLLGQADQRDVLLAPFDVCIIDEDG